MSPAAIKALLALRDLVVVRGTARESGYIELVDDGLAERRSAPRRNLGSPTRCDFRLTAAGAREAQRLFGP